MRKSGKIQIRSQSGHELDLDLDKRPRPGLFLGGPNFYWVIIVFYVKHPYPKSTAVYNSLI